MHRRLDDGHPEVRACDDCGTPLQWESRGGYALKCPHCSRYYCDTSRYNARTMAQDYFDDMKRSKQS